MSDKPLTYTVFITERDQHDNETEVATTGCRFTTREDGSVVVFDDSDREVAAWARGRWTRASARLKTKADDA